MKSRKRYKRYFESKKDTKWIYRRLVAFVIAAAVVFTAYKTVQPYVNNYLFKVEMQRRISYAVGRAVYDSNVISDENIRKNVIEAAEKRGIVLEEKDIKISRAGGSVEIGVEYVVKVNYLIVKSDFHFQVRNNSYSL